MGQLVIPPWVFGDKTINLRWLTLNLLGFVRGLDLDNNTLVLLTPEPFDRLDSVTHLVLSSVTAPPSLLMHADGVKGCVPYVSFGTLVDLGQLTKRPYLPPRK